MSGLALLTKHAHVLACVAGEPGMRLRDIAECLGITERAAHRLVCELEEARYLSRQRIGRRNYYEVHVNAPVQHPLEAERTVGELLAPVLQPSRRERAA